MSSSQFEEILKDKHLAAEIQEKFLGAQKRSGPAPSDGFESLPIDGAGGLESLPEVSIAERASIDRGFEAIVERFGRPSLLVKNGTFEMPASDTWKARLDPTRSRLERAINSVGRLELVNHSLSWAGTAWIIDDGIAVTNRHVADLFSQKHGSEEFTFRHNPMGAAYGARVDFKEEHLQRDVLEIEIEKILYVADNNDQFPDLAFLKLKRDPLVQMPPPIPLADQAPSPGQTVAVIGYPAYDPRNDASDMTRIFGDAYGVKRLAPGEVRSSDGENFTHDCTTLGGNSGSVVIDVASGEALGLHFAGEYLRANFAVSAAKLKEFLTQKVGAIKPAAPQTGAAAQPGLPAPVPGPADIERPAPTIEEMGNRRGYQEDFLGAADLTVKLPKLSAGMEREAAAVDGAVDHERYVLKYTNYSVVMNSVRRLAFFTATNIDGAGIQRIKRSRDSWFYDPRIPREFQVGNELYRGNDLDRGHLTRRLDPAWGQDPKQAEEDTFFFTNCTPQHHNFNTKTWLQLEDFLLENAETRDFRACVFTGPVFSLEDRRFEFRVANNLIGNILIPLQYWKVVAMINDQTGKLSATAYTISQKDLISNLEFVFGQFKTYQLPIAAVEKSTGLDFGDLKNYDPLRNVEGVVTRELTSLDEIVV